MTTESLRHEVEVDTKLAEIWENEHKQEALVEEGKSSLYHHLGYKKEYHGRSRQGRYPFRKPDELVQEAVEKLASGNVVSWERDYFERAIEKIRNATDRLHELDAEAAPLEGEYSLKRWSRFFLVTNANGHIHSSMSCSTCYPETRFAWLPELSGLTEKDAVEAYGPRLCTVCYPTAPVEWTNANELEAAAREAQYCQGKPAAGTLDFRGWNNHYGEARCDTCGKYIRCTQSGALRKHKGS